MGDDEEEGFSSTRVTKGTPDRAEKKSSEEEDD